MSISAKIVYCLGSATKFLRRSNRSSIGNLVGRPHCVSIHPKKDTNGYLKATGKLITRIDYMRRLLQRSGLCLKKDDSTDNTAVDETEAEFGRKLLFFFLILCDRKIYFPVVRVSVDVDSKLALLCEPAVDG